ncbi:sulfate transporter family-domain-containing protein [Pterulicium gracile]|uniref:Sulfate transporter family-domain-containing protein n=1 Tax=Pterulicium gracile TaxID=1884261 RepID=A0A5C3QB72_9AGAR|nr:sulfate transporter family-domain-containing protein [Pterula gracilis]
MPPTQPPPPPPPPRHTSSSDSVSTLHPAGSEEEELVTPVTTKNRGTVRIVTPTPPHDERTPLLAPQPPSTPPSSSSSWLHSKTSLARLVDSVRQHAPDVPSQTAQALPAVGLGALLNILDGVSYGMIMFPASGVFADKGSMGVSMFFVTAIISQLAYSLGGSGFAGANGSMMIEVVPFFHIIGNSIAQYVGHEEANAPTIICTTLVAFAMSSMLTGATFFILGYLRLGAIIGFFPRHILVGCIGGVGAFLIETGLAVCMRIDDDDFTIEFSTLKFMLQPHMLAMWVPPLVLAALLRVITHRWRHQLIFPLYFVLVPVVFYLIVLAARINISTLRSGGWVFDIQDGEDSHWYEFYQWLHWNNIHWGALADTLPTQLALLFFNILHPPLNVPALAVSLNEDVDTNRELVAHGYSNLFAGLFVTVPNYLVYVNTLLFYRVGGTTRYSGFLLALANLGLLLVGTGPIGYLPVIVVGTLIFVLGIDLIKEALWDTRKRVTRMEYATIVSIMVAMTIWDFVIGVLFGIVVSCLFFVVQNSQAQSIRAIHTGETAMSVVRRPSAQRAYLREVSKQTMIMRLQGFLFFGTITNVESTIRKLTSPARFPTLIRFLVLDLTLVGGVDMSAAESFVRVHRLLRAKGIVLIFCGLQLGEAVHEALCSVGLVASEDGGETSAVGVEVFQEFGDAMEWIENAYLRAWWRARKGLTDAVTLPLPARTMDSLLPDVGDESKSPRFSHLKEVASRTLDAGGLKPPQPSSPSSESQAGDMSVSSLASQLVNLVPYFTRVLAEEGDVLFRRGQPADCMYVVESGVLRATYDQPHSCSHVHEAMVAGTLTGELSFLSGQERSATVVVERSGVLWRLTAEGLRKAERERSEDALRFVREVVKTAKADYETLLSALATRQ